MVVKGENEYEDKHLPDTKRNQKFKYFYIPIHPCFSESRHQELIAEKLELASCMHIRNIRVSHYPQIRKKCLLYMSMGLAPTPLRLNCSSVCFKRSPFGAKQNGHTF